MEIKTKFNVGDVVYEATVTEEVKEHPCPDCFGAKKWSCVSPAGIAYAFPCPRCQYRYGDRSADLRYSVYKGITPRITLGSVDISTARNEIRYMAHETGIGSGRLYDENLLYASQEEAQAAADARAAELNTKPDERVAKHYAKSLEVAQHALVLVDFEERKKHHEKLVDMARTLRYAVDDAVGYMNESNPDGYDVKYAVEYLRKGLAKFTGEEVGGVSPDDATDEMA